MSVQTPAISYRKKFEDFFVSTSGTLEQINMIDDRVISTVYDFFQSYKTCHKKFCHYKKDKHIQYILKFQSQPLHENGGYLTSETINSAGEVEVVITSCKLTPLPKKWIFTREQNASHRSHTYR